MNRAAEARRRRTLKVAVATIAGAALVPPLIYDGSIAAVLAKCEAFVRECLAALLQLSPAQWIPAALLLAGVAYAAVDFLRQTGRVRRVLRLHRVRSPAPGEPIHALAQSHGALGQVHVIEGPAPNPAFAAGLLRPRLYLAADLQRGLPSEELRALFRHELWHVRHRDPLRFALLRALSRFLFWLPIIASLSADLVDDAEIQADDFAADAADPLEVAGALVAVARRTGATLALAASAGGPRPIERRVRRLLDDDAPAPPLPIRRLTVSLAALLVLWIGIGSVTPGAASAASTMASDRMLPHCPACPDSESGAGHAGCHLLHLLTGRL